MSVAKKISSGKWQVRFRDLEGVQRARNFRSKKEADEFRATLDYELKNGTWLDHKKGNVPLVSIWPDFIALKAAKKESTKADYESLWRIHLNPKWGKMPINRITQSSFDKWVIELGLSERRTRKLHLLASMIFDFAVKEGKLKRNPLKDATGKRDQGNLPVVPKRQVGTALSLEDLMMVSSKAGYYESHILFLGITGARWGEFVALQVSDFDATRGVIKICKSASEICGRLVFSPTTKTHQDREVKLPGNLLSHIEKMVKGKASSDPLFTTEEGYLMRSSNFAKRVLSPALESCGIEHIRIHDLRWTAISIASSIGISQQIVRTQVGHSNAHMTNAYTQIFKADQTEAVEKMDLEITRVHEMCTEQKIDQSEIEAIFKETLKNEANLGIDQIEGWLRQQDYESDALTN